MYTNLSKRRKTLKCSLEVSQFEISLCCYIHFRTNALKKILNSLIYPSRS